MKSFLYDSKDIMDLSGKKIAEYKMVAGNKCGDMNRAVNPLLKEGWLVYGNPFDSEGFMCQAMIRLEIDTE